MPGLDLMKRRIRNRGNDMDEINNNGKLRSMKSALWNSYQGEWITYNGKRHRCLINPSSVKDDYDKKVLSIDYKSKIKNGEVLFWDRTKTHWLAYLQDYAEEAYFRSMLIKCDYQLDIDGTLYWVYVRGPVQSNLIWRQKHQTEANDMNYSLLVYITKNEQTNNFIERHKQIKFNGHNWKVSVVDRYSTDGVIEFYLDEDFDNQMLDAMVAPEIVKVDTAAAAYIEGPQVISYYDGILTYQIVGNAPPASWDINDDRIKILDQDGTTCRLQVVKSRNSVSHEIVLSYGDIKLELLIETI